MIQLTIDISEERKHIKLAFYKAMRIIREGKKLDMSFVLPTRYGKSDLLRLITLVSSFGARVYDGEKDEDGEWIKPPDVHEFEATHYGCYLATPNRFLSKQFIDAQKWEDFLKRIQCKGAPRIKRVFIEGVDKEMANLTPRNELIATATMQWTASSTSAVVLWAESQLDRNERPPLFLFDEVHTQGDGLPWHQAGEDIQAKTNTHRVVVTATAERADGLAISGFQQQQIEEEKKDIYRTKDHPEDEDKVIVQKNERTETTFRQVADHFAGFDVAFGEGVLSTVDIEFVDMEVTLNGEKRKISDLTADEFQKNRSKIMTDPRVLKVMVSAGLKMWVSFNSLYRSHIVAKQRELFSKRKETTMNPNGRIKMVFFVRPNEDGRNKQIEFLRKNLNSLARDVGYKGSLKMAEVTMDEEENLDTSAEQLLLDWDYTDYDVIILKSMAGAGWDTVLTKAMVDLSSVRTYSACAQRWMRTNTPFDDHFPVASWVLLADVMSRSRFDQIVSSQGGRSKKKVEELISEYEKDRSEAEADELFIDREVGGLYGDYTGKRTEDEIMVLKCRYTRYRLNKVKAGHGDALSLDQLYQLYQDMNLDMDADKAYHAMMNGDVDEMVGKTTNEEVKDERTNLNDEVKADITDRVMEHLGISIKKYGVASREVWHALKRAAHWKDPKLALDKNNDPGELRAVRDQIPSHRPGTDNFKRIVSRVRYRLSRQS